nr:tig: trigger factor [uncultured bacterium]
MPSAGFADGKQFAGGTAEKQTLVLGSGTFIPGFEEQLTGKNPGDNVTVHVTFPSQYHAPELAGKAAQFRCHIHEIRTVAPYALDDTFAKEIGHCETMDEMRANMRKSLETYYAERAELELRDRLLRQAAATMDGFTPDPAEIGKAIEEQLDTMSAQLAQKNLTLDDYCKFTNSTLEQMREDARPGAEEAVRIKELVRRVAQAEDLHAHEEDVAQALSEICRANHMTMEELQPYYDDAFAAAVEHSILLAKVTKRIRESAVLEA